MKKSTTSEASSHYPPVSASRRGKV
jgi:hypothetical protein